MLCACSFTPVACVFDTTAKMATMCSQSSASTSEIDAIAEFDNLCSLEENEKGSVHGLVGQVSPMTVGKTGKGYFHALLTDGAQDIKIVGFGKSQRNILKDFEEKGDPVALKGCRTKRSRYTKDMEVILRPETNLSPKKIKVDPDRFAVKNSDINVNDVDSMVRFKQVSLYAKVIRVDEAAVVSDGLKVQNVIIADANRAIKMALWENDIGRLSKGKSYHLVNVVVYSFQGANFLQFPKGEAEAHEVEDIGTVAEDDVPSLEDEVHDSEVAGVLALDCYVACLGFKSKVDKKSDVLGTCSRCGMVHKLLKCSDQKRARLVFTLPGARWICQCECFWQALGRDCRERGSHRTPSACRKAVFLHICKQYCQLCVPEGRKQEEQRRLR